MEKAKELITQAQNNNILSFDIKVFYTKIIEEAKSYQGLIFTEETIGDAKKILAEARKHREEIIIETDKEIAIERKNIAQIKTIYEW